MTGADSPTWDASLSTSWAKILFPSLEDFFIAARQMGFAAVELNHEINSAMLDGIDLRQYRFSSLHEPCPADISTRMLKERDWLISAQDEDNRRQGVEAVKRSIHLAHTLNAGVVVIHSGNVQYALGQETQLRALIQTGKQGSDEFQEVREEMICARARLAGPRVDAVRKSILELLAYAEPFGIRLGLENRDHFMEIPLLEELGSFLELAPPERLGFIYDVGHAQALDRFGITPHEEWLRRFAGRVLIAHLHDVHGLKDHLAPGLGEMDFDMISGYLPGEAIRTVELNKNHTPDQVKAGLDFLVDHRCVFPKL